MIQPKLLLQSKCGMFFLALYACGILFGCHILFKDWRLQSNALDAISEPILAYPKARRKQQGWSAVRAMFYSESGERFICKQHISPHVRNRVQANSDRATITYQKNNPENCVIEQSTEKAFNAKLLIGFCFFMIMIGAPLNRLGKS